jgi:hypothetical protein
LKKTYHDAESQVRLLVAACVFGQGLSVSRAVGEQRCNRKAR